MESTSKTTMKGGITYGLNVGKVYGLNVGTKSGNCASSVTGRRKGDGTAKKPWDKPVSQSFYQKLVGRVEEIFRLLGYARGWRDEFMKFIDRYLKSGECPKRRYHEEFVLAIFYSLKGEVDVAIARSAACKRRAAERRARKEAEKNKPTAPASPAPGVSEAVETSMGNSAGNPEVGDMSMGNSAETPEAVETSMENTVGNPEVSDMSMGKVCQEEKREESPHPAVDRIEIWRRRYGDRKHPLTAKW